MNIYLIKNGQNAGPYTETEVLSRLKAGIYALTDLAWYDGCQEPMPLAKVLFALKSAQANQPSGVYSPAELAQLTQNQAVFTVAIVSTFLLAVIPLPADFDGAGRAVGTALAFVCLGAGWRLARSLRRKGWVWVLLLLCPFLSWLFAAYLIWVAFKTVKENKRSIGTLAQTLLS
jgi:hypothetical protein